MTNVGFNAGGANRPIEALLETVEALAATDGSSAVDRFSLGASAQDVNLIDGLSPLPPVGTLASQMPAGSSHEDQIFFALASIILRLKHYLQDFVEETKALSAEWLNDKAENIGEKLGILRDRGKIEVRIQNAIESIMATALQIIETYNKSLEGLIETL